MEATTYSNLRNNLANILDKINQDHSPILIKRQNGEDAVLMGARDFNAFEEMRHLTASMNNISAINESIKSLKEGRGVELSLDDIDDL